MARPIGVRRFQVQDPYVSWPMREVLEMEVN